MAVCGGGFIGLTTIGYVLGMETIGVGFGMLCGVLLGKLTKKLIQLCQKEDQGP